MFLLSSSPILASLGTVFIVLLVGGLVWAFVYLVQYSLRVARELAQANANAHRHEINSVVMSRTLDAEKVAARATGRLEGLMVHMSEYGNLVGFQAKAEALEQETSRLRTELHMMQSDRGELLHRYNRAIERVNESNARANDYRLNKGSEKEEGRVKTLSGKGPQLVRDDAGKLPGSSQPDSTVVFKRNRSYYLDWEEDKETIGLYHVGMSDALRKFKLAEIEKGSFTELAGGIGVLWCGSQVCDTLKVTDRRAEAGRYCSKDCNRQDQQLQKVTSLSLTSNAS